MTRRPSGILCSSLDTPARFSVEMQRGPAGKRAPSARRRRWRRRRGGRAGAADARSRRAIRVLGPPQRRLRHRTRKERKGKRESAFSSTPPPAARGAGRRAFEKRPRSSASLLISLPPHEKISAFNFRHVEAPLANRRRSKSDRAAPNGRSLRGRCRSSMRSVHATAAGKACNDGAGLEAS